MRFSLINKMNPRSKALSLHAPWTDSLFRRWLRVISVKCLFLYLTNETQMLYPCEHTLFITLSLSEGILRRGGGGEKRQEIINSPSSQLTPPSHPEVKGQGGAAREGEPAGVWWPLTSPQRSPPAPSESLSHTSEVF